MRDRLGGMLQNSAPQCNKGVNAAHPLSSVGQTSRIATLMVGPFASGLSEGWKLNWKVARRVLIFNPVSFWGLLCIVFFVEIVL